MHFQLERLYFQSPVFLQNLLISVYGYHLLRKRYSGTYKNIRKRLQFVNELDEKKVKDLQEEKLHEMVVFCNANIPYYRRLFSDQGISPSDITSLSDIEKIPILDKQMLKKNWQDFRPIKPIRPYAVQNTSGSTGSPLSLEVNEYTYKLAMALLVEHEENLGIKFGERRATFAGRMIKPADCLKPPFSRFNVAENQRLFSSYHLNIDTFSYYDSELTKFQPAELIGYPSAISNLASHYLRSKSQPNFKPKAIITNSETLLIWQRSLIENVFNCPVYDYYGTAEYVIFAGQRTDGLYYPNPLLGVTEVLTDAPEAIEGHLVGTTLTNFCMPLLRYDLGDTATLATSEGPTIGAPVIRSFNGRTDDYIDTKDGRSIGRIDHIFKGIKGIREAQVIQEQPGRIRIKLVKEASEALNEMKLISNCKQRLGSDFHIKLDYVDHIPRGKNGKFRSVIKECNV